VWLEAVADKEKHLREEAESKQSHYSSKISQLENDLARLVFARLYSQANIISRLTSCFRAKQKVEDEQRQYEQLKQDVEQKLQDKRDQFENYTREAASHLNDLNNQVTD